MVSLTKLKVSSEMPLEIVISVHTQRSVLSNLCFQNEILAGIKQTNRSSLIVSYEMLWALRIDLSLGKDGTVSCSFCFLLLDYGLKEIQGRDLS